MIVCVFEHIQWRWALNDFTAHGQAGPRSGADRLSFARSMVFKRGALMRASWTKGRLWAVVPTAGMELPAVVVTKPLLNVTAGVRLVINAKTVRGGKVTAELLQPNGKKPIAGFELSDSMAFVGDEVAAVMRWTGGQTRLPHAATTGGLQIKFMLYDARLYSFELQ